MKKFRLSLLLFFLCVSATSFGQNIHASFMWGSACQGGTTQFYDSSYAVPPTFLAQWYWNFGDPASGNSNVSVAQNPSHVYSNAGSYDVRLIVFDNMGNADSTAITVQVGMKPALAWGNLPSVCLNAPHLSIGTATVTNGVAGYGHYSGPGIINGSDTFVASTAGVGIHAVTYVFTSFNGCVDSIKRNIEVTAVPSASFTVNRYQQCESGNMFVFSNTSTGMTGALTYIWSFGDGSSSTSTNPVHTYTAPGTYSVKLTATSNTGCTSTMTQTVTVSLSPAASFDFYYYDSICFRNLVYFYSTSTNVDTLKFTFGDGALMYGTSVYHAYTAPGTYAVKLVAKNSCGSDSITKTVTIVPESKTILPDMPRMLIANRECESDNGWTNYYFDNNTPDNSADDTLLLSLKLNGQYIGKVGDGTFQLKLQATAGAGSNTGILLTNPLITNPTGYWVMNRYWNVLPTMQPSSPVGVRFYFNTQDLNDVNGSYPSHNLTYNDLIFYKTRGGNPDPTSNLAGATSITSIMNGAVADTSHWVYTSLSADRHMAEFKVTHFSGGGGGGTGNNQALPLKLVSFDAQKADKTVRLVWTTSVEVNVKEFEVERSDNGAEFNKIGTVKAKGITGTTPYTFTDYTPLAGRNFYRLKMVDNDGRSSYSIVRTVSNKAGVEVSVYPNPVKDVLSLKMESNNRENITVEILNMEGKVLQTVNTVLNAGSAVRELNASSLKAGTYYLRITTNGERIVRKFMKM